MKKRALLSVSDKTGIVQLAKELVALGFEVLSTGGTAKTLKENNVPVTPVSEATGFPEILEGRVKSLHPKIHGGILAKRIPEHFAQLEENSIIPIDVVAVNLYPFKQTISKPNVTIDEAIENIDIGGPSMVRSAAKNHAYVTVVVNPSRYADIIAQLKANGDTTAEFRRELAYEAFTHTAQYDLLISNYLRELLDKEKFTPEFTLNGEKIQDLRYGENPHQKAAFYRTENTGIAAAEKLQGKELSFNNIMDLEAAWNIVQEFTEPACVIIKHTNPCGVAIADTLADAYVKAYEADPVSAFGGIVGLNREVDAKTAAELVKIFLEAVAAPSFSKDALEILSQKQNVRLMTVPTAQPEKLTVDIKKVSGGFLVQEKDTQLNQGDWKWVTEQKAADNLTKDLDFAWKIVKHVKSNAIVIAKDGVTTGVGPGQTNRVGAAKIALETSGEKAKGAVLASDAFFPFHDTIDLAAEYGVKAIVQPGGSLKDEESIAACNKHGIAMAFTGMRHFKH
ncbi:bifunctional phosphoribosylaminoimidazolecarboxamide formyltransferase/IMP cyclohydrolase [Bacillota bacterium LX-D]|nr:bifunctional phosphoribosylaminoimidazolecarboxamide formyltransferase/IMP cyclohydrolase [Bacillota bacterium LX-D]